MWSEEVFVCMCVCIPGPPDVIGYGCLPKGDCWPHTQALSRQRRVVNNRKAMTEGRQTQTEITIKVKDGGRCNSSSLSTRH